MNDGNGVYTYDKTRLPNFRISTSCVRPFDYDNDGDLDLFVGGRITPKAYPIQPNSYLLQNDNGVYKNVTKTVAPKLLKLGMVTDAEWVDIDNDNSYELVVLGEWMPITVFKQLNKKFIIQDAASNGFTKSNGWWFSIKTQDFDNDGDRDIIAGNLGLNYKYKASKSLPFMMYAKDFDNNSKMDIVLSYPEKGVYYPVRGRECSSQQLPFIKDKFPDYKSFASASVDEMLGYENIKSANCNFDLKNRYEIMFKITNSNSIENFDKYLKNLKQEAELENNFTNLGIDINKDYSKIISGVNILRLSNNPVELKKEDLKKIIQN